MKKRPLAELMGTRALWILKTLYENEDGVPRSQPAVIHIEKSIAGGNDDTITTKAKIKAADGTLIEDLDLGDGELITPFAMLDGFKLGDADVHVSKETGVGISTSLSLSYEGKHLIAVYLADKRWAEAEVVSASTSATPS